MKTITIAGRVTRDAETRDAGSDRVTSFSVAVDDRQGREKSTIFFDCSLWGKRGESLCQYLTKGAPVSVSGELGKREHDGKTYLTVRVNDVALQGGKAQASESFSGGRDEGFSGRGGAGVHSQSSGGRGDAPSYYDLNDDIPF